jgi:hypothetical protein
MTEPLPEDQRLRGISPRAYEHRFRTIFRDAGAGVEKAGERVADAAEKLTDWLRSGRG